MMYWGFGKHLVNSVIMYNNNCFAVFVVQSSLDDIRAVFFPKDFYEKYQYLGSIPYGNGDIFKAMEPLVIFMDYKAKPKYCPRWDYERP